MCVSCELGLLNMYSHFPVGRNKGKQRRTRNFTGCATVKTYSSTGTQTESCMHQRDLVNGLPEAATPTVCCLQVANKHTPKPCAVVKPTVRPCCSGAQEQFWQLDVNYMDEVDWDVNPFLVRVGSGASQLGCIWVYASTVAEGSGFSTVIGIFTSGNHLRGRFDDRVYAVLRSGVPTTTGDTRFISTLCDIKLCTNIFINEHFFHHISN